MVTSDDSRSQAALESKAAGILGTVTDDRKTAREIFGDRAEWEMVLGPYRFLLLPFNGEWWFWDGVHNDWKYTGYHAGEVIFTVNGPDVEFRQPGTGTDQTRPAVPQKKFCHECGAPLGMTAKFCNNCGTMIK